MKVSMMLFIFLGCLAGCARLGQVGQTPNFTPAQGSDEAFAMSTPGLLPETATSDVSARASLWTGNRGSLLGDRRATQRGDILTVVIEIDDSAEISNSSSRGRTGTESLAIGQLLGLEQWIDRRIPGEDSALNAVDVQSSSNSTGDGSVSRNEQLELKVAATIVDVTANGMFRIQGSQEVRVNFELRELLVSGYIRPGDISRQNEITYDKIASARISYGGRGQISDVQQPRYGQQVSDILLPF